MEYKVDKIFLSTHPTIKANGTLVVNDVIEIRFTIMSGKNGLWVKMPSRKSDKVDPETGRPIWYNNVRILDEGERKKIEALVLQAYQAFLQSSAEEGTQEEQWPPF